MLVEQAQVGCVLGKGGDVISDLRRRTGANIRVSDKRDLPACAGSEDSLVAVRLVLHPHTGSVVARHGSPKRARERLPDLRGPHASVLKHWLRNIYV